MDPIDGSTRTSQQSTPYYAPSFFVAFGASLRHDGLGSKVNGRISSASQAPMTRQVDCRDDETAPLAAVGLIGFWQPQ